MKISELPEFSPGDIATLVSKDQKVISKPTPRDIGEIFQGIYRQIVILLGTGTGPQGDFLHVASGMIEENPVGGRHQLLSIIDEVIIHGKII